MLLARRPRRVAGHTRGHQAKVATMPPAVSPRATTLREITGLWTAVVDADSNKMLRAALLGHESGDVVAAVPLAMLGG